MSFDFLTAEHGCYVVERYEEQLAGYVHLDERDRALIILRRGKHNRLEIERQLTTAGFLVPF
jgi:hypothetical protein